jgi:ATP-binding cassette subfamily B protein
VFGKNSAERSLLRWCMRQEARRLAVGMGCSVVLQAGLIAIPWCLKQALDDGIIPGDLRIALIWAAVIVGLGGLVVCAEIGRALTMRVAADSVGNRLRRRVLEHVLKLDQTALSRFGHGDLATRATRDTDLLHFWVYGLSLWAQLLTALVLVTAAIGSLEPVLLLVVAAMVPPLVVLNLIYPKRYARAARELASAHSDRADSVADLLTATLAVRGIGGEPVLVRQHDERSAVVTDRTRKMAAIAAGWASTVPMVPRLAIAAGVAVGGLSVLDQDLTIGGLVAFTSWMATVTTAVAVLVDRLDQRSQALVAAGRISEILQLGPVNDGGDADRLPGGGALVAEDLVVRFGERVAVGPVRLAVEPGEFVAVTGPIGSGKSTLLRALGRVVAPSAGTVRYAGTDLAAVSGGAVRRSITFVPQRPVLLSGTIAENLRLGRDQLTDSQVRAACEVAAILTDIEGFPDGFETVVGERGATLSGGQIQRLALARALLQPCDVLLLDDVTSAVDVATEQAILARVRAWSPRTSIVFAAYRQAVLDAADRVVTLPAPGGAGVAPSPLADGTVEEALHG